MKAALAILLALFFVVELSAQLTYDRIRQAVREPGSWLTYSGTYSGHRFSPLAQINRANVSRLKLAWMYQTNDLNQFEATPLVADGVMYISEPPSNAAALDLKTGRPLWIFRRTAPSDVRLCCGQVNRGLAILGRTVFLGTVDAHLLALDAITGHVLWDVTVADNKLGYSITVAPLAVLCAWLGGVMSAGRLYVPGELMPAAEIRERVAAEVGGPLVADSGDGVRGLGPATYWRVASGPHAGRRLGVISVEQSGNRSFTAGADRYPGIGAGYGHLRAAEYQWPIWAGTCSYVAQPRG